MISPDLRRAYFAIEDDLTELRSATGVLHLAFHDLSECGQGNCALAQSIFFTARSVEAIINRIETTLGAEKPGTEEAAEPCARGLEAPQ